MLEIIKNQLTGFNESLQNAETQRKEYGAQRSVPNNEDTINQAPADIQATLK
jgi:hypothetical protein